MDYINVILTDSECILLGVPKEKISDETPLELIVEAKAQWILLRKEISSDLIPPLSADNVLLSDVFMDKLNRSAQFDDPEEGKTDKWLSQVEIITHAGPHRRLWMGPQFTFRVRLFISYLYLKIIQFIMKNIY